MYYWIIRVLLVLPFRTKHFLSCYMYIIPFYIVLTFLDGLYNFFPECLPVSCCCCFFFHLWHISLLVSLALSFFSWEWNIPLAVLLQLKCACFIYVLCKKETPQLPHCVRKVPGRFFQVIRMSCVMTVPTLTGQTSISARDCQVVY